MKRPRMSVESARHLVNETISHGPAGHTLTALFENRGWDSLGYGTWDDLVRSELAVVLDPLPEGERTELAISMRRHGASLRGIASVVKWSHTKVQSRTDDAVDESEHHATLVLESAQVVRRTVMSLESLTNHPDFQYVKHLIGDDLARELRAVHGALQNVALSNT